MKNKFYIVTALLFSIFEIANAQTAAVTSDNVALPTTFNTTSCSNGGTIFPALGVYNANATGIRLGVNNTGTDICQLFPNPATIIQAMVWDNVSVISPLTSNVYLSWTVNGVPTGSFTFPIPTGENGGFDPDVAIFSDSFGTYLQVVFENNTTNAIDGYSFIWNGTTFVPNTGLTFKSTLSHDITKKAKNPNISVAKNKGEAMAVVWHEEGLANPGPTITVSYPTVPPTVYTSTPTVLQSRVYIYCADKPGSTLSDLILGSATITPRNFPGVEVIRTSTDNHLFDRNFNPDVSFNESFTSSGFRTISVTFLSQWFDPAGPVSIVTGKLSVVQGISSQFNATTPSNVQTITYNFTTLISGKPRIASRLPYTGVITDKDFSVVMGNSGIMPIPCAPGQQVSQLFNWWCQDGVQSLASGVDLLGLGTPYSTSFATDPVISCIQGKGYYNVTFSAFNNATSGFDIVSNTYYQGNYALTPTFSYVNRGICHFGLVSDQIVPSVASFKLASSLNTDYAVTNYLFWDQFFRSLNFKATTNANIPGNGALKQAQIQPKIGFIVYPNPTENEVMFDFKLDNDEVASEIEIFNMIGQSVDKFSVEAHTTEQKRDINKMPSGTYIAVLKTNAKEYKLEFVKK